MSATPTAVQLTNATPGDLLDIPGMVVDIAVETRPIQRRVNKFFGVDGESIITGGSGGRQITVRMVVYDTSATPLFDTARKLSDFLDYDVATEGLEQKGTLTLVSESDHSPFADTVFDGMQIIDGPKPDSAGTVGGDYWAEVLLSFRQLSNGAAEVVGP